jgi:uncharacterized membrane protein YbhN (UPF0104 family)
VFAAKSARERGRLTPGSTRVRSSGVESGSVAPTGQAETISLTSVHAWVRRTLATRRAKLIVNGVSVTVALVVAALAALHFERSGWPLARADVLGMTIAALLFLVAYGFKAYGWHRLFAPDQRPDPLALAAAGGAASVTGIALPGRFDEVVRIAVVRRFPGPKVGIGGVCLSLLLLGLIDSAALTPLASVAAASASSTAFRVGLAVVAGAGIGAAAIVLSLRRLALLGRLVRFRSARWVHVHCACPREASKAWALVSVSWLVRGAALLMLMDAVGMGASIPLALAYLCASAASAALPVAPAGAATQAGAGAAVLIASGIPTSEAVAFAIAAQTLLILTGAGVVAAAGLWKAGGRLVPSRA